MNFQSWASPKFTFVNEMFYLYFNSFTAKRLFIRNRLQNTFDRTFKELSNDIKICEIRLQLNPIEAEEARRLRRNAVKII